MKSELRTIGLIATVGGALGVATGIAYAGRRVPSPAPQSASPPPANGVSVAQTQLRVPLALGALEVDGELDDDFWTAPPARTGPFLMKGAVARPYSDARIARTNDALVIALYAADEDVRASSDSFRLAFDTAAGRRELEVFADGRVRGDVAGVRVGHDIDGSFDDPSDDDEEWVLEVVVPLASVGLDGRCGERVGFAVSRCDTPRNAARVCAEWAPRGGTLILD